MLTRSNLGETGLAFLALGLGMVIGTATQPIFIRRVKDNAVLAGGKAPPEARLPVGMAGAIVAPLGLLWFALSSFAKMPWIMPMIGTLIFGIGVGVAVQSRRLTPSRSTSSPASLAFSSRRTQSTPHR